MPLIDRSECDGCGHCFSVCPTQALSIRDGKAVVSDPLDCDYHGFCERVYPMQAIPFEIVLAEQTVSKKRLRFTRPLSAGEAPIADHKKIEL